IRTTFAPMPAIRKAVRAVLASALLWTASAAAQERPVDLELLLAVDVSASVNHQEYFLQMFGLAQAFRDEEVHRAISAAAPNGIAVGLLQWSGQGEVALAVPWHRVDDAASAERF